MPLEHYINNKNVLYITTKNTDYIRVSQELKLLGEKTSKYRVIGSRSRFYPMRILSVFLKILFENIKYYDTVFIGFAPQLVIPLWWFKLKKADIVTDFFISFYDTLCFDRKKIKPDSILGRFIHYIDKGVLKKSALVVCDTVAHGKYFADEFHIPFDKFYTLYLEADTSIYHPLNLTRPGYLKNKFVVIYFGSGLPLQGIDTVLKAMALLKDDKELHFFFIGHIRNKEAAVQKPVSDNIEYLEWVSQDKLAEYIDISDLCLAGHFNAEIKKAGRVIAGKTFIYQAMDKMMILGDNAANRELFRESDMISFVEMGNEFALAQKIKKIKEERLASIHS